MDARALLVQSVADITLLSPSQIGSDAATAAFISLRKGVNQASSAHSGHPEVLLDLEPKAVVLRFLVDFYGQRRIFRKQIVAVVDELLHVDSWRRALGSDSELCSQLPDDLARLLSSRQSRGPEFVSLSRESPSVSHARSNASRGSARPVAPEASSAPLIPLQTPMASSPFEKTPARPSDQQQNGLRRQRLSKACFLPIRVAAPSVSGNVILSKSDLNDIFKLLEHGRIQIEKLDYSAADADPAISAFETFRRAVQQAMNTTTASKQDLNLLEKLEAKGKILDFLVDMYERHQKYRSRVTGTISRLLNFDSWNHAADNEEIAGGSAQEPDLTAFTFASATSPAGDVGAADTAKWTPWGPAVASQPSPAKSSRSRNPFAADVAAKHGGNFDIWKDFGAWQKPLRENERPKRENAEAYVAMSPAASETSTASGLWGSSPRMAKPSNPFSADVQRGGSAVPTNPFKRDVRSPASRGPKAAPCRDVFTSDSQMPAFAPKVRW